MSEVVEIRNLAVMGTEVPDTNLELHESDLDCSVCHDLFTDPKLLPCAHLICRQCLLSWLSTKQEATCPLCRFAIAEGKNLKSAPKEVLEKVVSDLPGDDAMAAVVENARLLRVEHFCVGCQQCQAVSICLDCRDMLCGTCTTTHRNLSATRNHMVETLSTMTAAKLSRSQPASCCVHPDRTSELFCPTHKAAICHLCASSVHRACPEVILFENHLRELKKKMSEDADKLLTADKGLESKTNDLDSKLKDSEMKAKQSLAEIDEACDRLENSVNACRQRLKKLVSKSSEEVKQSIQKAKADLVVSRARITSQRRLFDRVYLTTPPGKLEQASEMIHSFFNDIDDKTISDDIVVNLSKVHVNFGIVRRLERELAFLGEEHSVPEEKLWRFLSTPNISITDGGRTAERIVGTSNIVFSDTPMTTGLLYEVVIEEVRGNSADVFPCGVVKTKPSDLLDSLPDSTLRGWKEAVVFSSSVYVYGSKRDFEIGAKLKGLKEGTKVGLLRDPGGYLHLYIDGERQWVFVTNVLSNCYAFFELLHVYRKITCLPPIAVQKVLKG